MQYQILDNDHTLESIGYTLRVQKLDNFYFHLSVRPYRPNFNKYKPVCMVSFTLQMALFLPSVAIITTITSA